MIEGDARYHGSFANTCTETIADADHLLQAAEHNVDALRYLDFINTRLQGNNRDRTVGQQSIVTRWGTFIHLNADRRDQARADVGLPIPHKKVRRNDHRMDTDEAPAAPPDAATHQAWIASLRPGQRGFANVPASQWPAGLRQVVNGQPLEVPRGPAANVYLEPHEGDCAAALTTRRLGPLRSSQDSRSHVRRQQFLRVWWGIFGTPGLFVRIAAELRLTVGDRELEHFPYDTSNLDVLTIVRWALDHGIGPDNRIVAILEDYAPRTLERQPNLRTFPPRPIDEWVTEFGPLLRDGSHTLRYPPMVSGTTVITTSSEIQLRARAPPASAGTTSIPGPAPDALASSSSTVGPGTPSAATGTVASALTSEGASTGLAPQDVDMDNIDGGHSSI